MQKAAQKRSIPSQLREVINMPGAYLEGIFKPELDRVMAALKALDDRVRSELTGKKIGDADAPEIEKSAKDLLRSARTNFNRREYMLGVADLGMFHKKMDTIVKDIDKWKVDVNKIHNKFLFEGLKPEDMERVKKLREYMEKGARMEAIEQLTKEAGIMDFYHNFLTTRGRGLLAWEKKYPKETKDLREGGAKLVTEAENLLGNVISTLKEMATARAIRRPDDYMEAANKIKAAFSKFDSGDKGFKAFYQNAVLPWMKIRDEIEAKEKTRVEQEQAKPQVAPAPEKIELGETPPAPPSPPSPPAPPSPGMPGNPPGASPPFAIPVVTEEEAPITERQPLAVPAGSELAKIPEGTKARVAHQQFLNSLEAMSQEDPRILAGFISKYASSIQGEDPETAIRLFTLVKQIRG
jgi:hypothetical protein